MQTDDTPEFRSRSDAETNAELERQIREATPGIADADVTAKAAEIKAAGIVAWTIPQTAAETSKLLFLNRGKTASIADALADLKPESTGPVKDPATLRQERTDAFMAEARDRRKAAAAPLTNPRPDVPDHKLTTEEYVQRQRWKRSGGDRRLA